MSLDVPIIVCVCARVRVRVRVRVCVCVASFFGCVCAWKAFSMVVKGFDRALC